MDCLQGGYSPEVLVSELLVFPAVILLGSFSDLIHVGFLLGAVFCPVSYLVASPACSFDTFAFAFPFTAFAFSSFFPPFSRQRTLFLSLLFITFAFP